MNRHDVDPDEARDLAFEDAHDERYGDRLPDKVAAARLQSTFADRYRLAMGR